MHHPIPRLFVLRRDRDITGVSGPGDVADGVQWPDGTVVLRWCERPSTSVWDSVDLMLSVHGHDGATRVVWADEEAQARHDFTESILTAYDLPASILGAEAERAYLHQQITRATLDAWEARGTRVDHPEGHCQAFAGAVMPIVGQVLGQRDRAQAAAGRAYKLADRWEAAHGSAAFLVRAAGAELRDELDGEQPATNAAATGATDHTRTSACEDAIGRIQDAAALHRKGLLTLSDLYAVIEAALDQPARRGATQATDGHPQCGRANASSCSNPDHACGRCGDCMYEMEA